ncbi:MULTISPECIES: DeoR/GlpR family DNA-binding transcription regulator [unclassified Microbacterium]|uniref:DeoR/GlpR family DNA-binding transcription regulator n=1 Tax=unclassified Microbacterium TaxID=2609290 RepID=UPI000D57CC31|nr:DeoR/GlpR family DNA-binding transcription regulator [Microbacterium sp. Gd 4-13]PVW06380.1 D-beta-D-heptose 1-phosphate adenosyltransferase [Microbacterium sp. Gd 4-13]
MYAMERQELVERLLREEGRVGVVDLSTRFGVTTETIRRDLALLEEAGTLRRVHGGAVATDRGSTVETPVSERALRKGDAKQAIGRRAAALLDAGFRGSVYLDAGTTVAAVAAALPLHLANSRGGAEIVTHSMTIAHDLAGSDLGLTVIGGRIRGLTAAAVGAETVAAISHLRPDVAFVGTNGLSEGFGLSTPDPDEAAVKAAIIAAARRVVVVTDAEKFGAELLVRFGGLTDIDDLVSDAAPESGLSNALGDAGAEVWVA